jgi:hypothetical protein
MTVRNEIPGSDVACESLDVRDGLDVGGVLTVGGRRVPGVVNTFDASTNPNTATADVETLFLLDGAEVTLQDGGFDGQRVQCVLLESPNTTVVVIASGVTYKTDGDLVIAHYALTFYWSNQLTAWMPTGSLQWSF